MRPFPPPDTADTGTGRGVTATVRLPHRRRSWAWTTVASVVLFLVAAGVTGALNPGPDRVPVWNAWGRPRS